jgi:ACS family hexuronate transporter-like MFS transporter
MPRPIPHLRWYIAGLIFVATVINYIDRQVFSILAPELQRAIGWSELDYGRIVIAFQLSYAVAMAISGRVLDRIGTKIGLGVSVLAWSVVEVAHAAARTAFGFGAARFCLGLTEASMFPAAVKTVAEWFPAKERALATGIFNSGVALGTVLASLIVPYLAAWYGWQAAFVITGIAGLIWVPLWWWLYADRATHPRLTDHDRTLVVDDAPVTAGSKVKWIQLLGYRQTWAYALTKFLGDPIWWFYLFWLPKFLAERFDIRGTAVAPYLMTVYIAADLGCLLAGWVSSSFVARGWSVNAARKTTMAMLASVMIPSVLTAPRLDSPWAAMALIALACGCHQGWSTVVFTVASDLFPSRAAASVTGFGGFIAGMASIGAAEVTGRILQLDPGNYTPMFIAAALLYPTALAVLHVFSPRMERAQVG